MKYIISFIKKETVFTISFILAIVSFFLVKPSSQCVSGIDFRVLVLLFSLMGVVAGLQRLLVFKRCGNFLTSKIKSTRLLYLLLIYLCFFSSMVLTNDVALITFVPFAIMLLPSIKCEKNLITIVILQTIAANLGSMLTPLGNPQNLFLYSVSEMSFANFIIMMLPCWLVSLILVTVPIFFIKNETITCIPETNLPPRNMKKELCYWILFTLCLLTVVRILPFQILIGVVIISLLIIDKKSLFEIDYFLLLTFVCFFLFIYNIKQIPAVNGYLSNIIEGKVFFVGLITSQIISNVPSSLLLAGFTNDYKSLTLAVDVGGLGTLIASLASLISFKLYSSCKYAKTGKYFLLFTLWNIIFLIILGSFTYFVLL